MELSKATRITLVICGAVTILGLAAISVWSGAVIVLPEIIGSLGTLAGVLVGLGVAGGRRKDSKDSN